ncbi:MAG: carboxylating nicotinate-nucleotide diphosphorylase [Armatimonadetes bacterium]|nr:carboxylating nicotinate-nucleotide diphosphorylase [Armatimonadota bacterium]
MSIWLQPEPHEWWVLVEQAMTEDIGHGDITGGCIPADQVSDWFIEAQDDGILSGAGIIEHLLGPYASDPETSSIEIRKNDGDKIRRGDVIAEGKHLTRRILMSERTILNFVMHMSGVATLTNQFVIRVEGTEAKIIDTRKTIPCIRSLQKYAVRCGGGYNHRMGLYDAALLKDNHIAASGSIRKAVAELKKYVSHMTKIEVECESLDQVEEAINAGADVVLLDNMDPFMMREAVQKFKDDVLFEASGGIGLDTVRGVALTGVHLISIGALTHSAPALPFHLEFE